MYFFFMAWQPLGGLGRLILRRFTITLRHTTLGRTPLDEWPARRRDLYLTTHNTHNRQTSIPSVGFEPTILVSERPQTHALDLAATGMGQYILLTVISVESDAPGACDRGQMSPKVFRTFPTSSTVQHPYFSGTQWLFANPVQGSVLENLMLLYRFFYICNFSFRSTGYPKHDIALSTILSVSMNGVPKHVFPDS
jgi:hypothetical protein